MTLWEHLGELRSRLFKAALALLITFAVGFSLFQWIFDILIQPYCQLPAELRAATEIFDGDDCRLIFTDVLGAFGVRVKTAAAVAIVFGGPVLFYQLWAFIVPGLKSKEKRFAAPFVVLSQLLFLAGGVFSYFVLPRGLEFLLGFAGEDMVSLMSATDYMSFLVRTMLAFGLAFEYPLIIAMLTIMGIVGHAGLKRYRRHAFFGSFVAAAIITPSQDPATMVIMALPLALFYELCVLFARFWDRRKKELAVDEVA